MRSSVFCVVPLLCSAVFLCAADSGGNDARQGWINLFDRESLYGWKVPPAGGWAVQQGGLIGDGQVYEPLETNYPLGDFELVCEYRASGDSQLILRQPLSSLDGQGEGVKIQLSSSAGFQGNANKSAWHELKVEALGRHIDAAMDGSPIGQGLETIQSAGAIQLQRSSGARLEIRSLRARPLHLESIFNGENLDGWSLFKPKQDPGQNKHTLLKIIPISPHKAKGADAKWTASSGVLQVENGPGQIHTNSAYGDFVLQMQVAPAKRSGHTNAELILRSDPNQLANGYRTPLGYDGKVPVGTIVSLHPVRNSRAIQGSYVETIIVTGRRIDTWVNGYLVNDFEDPRPAGSDLSREARIGTGPIALAALDETASMDLQSFRLAGLTLNPAPKPKEQVAATPPLANTPPQAAVPAPETASNRPPAQQPSVPDPALSLLMQQQGRQQQQRQQIAVLTQQALASPDPENQIGYYDRILAIDPTDQAAFNGRREAQQKLDSHNAALSRKTQQAMEQVSEERQREQSKQSTLESAQSALFQGDLNTARDRLATIRKVAPNDPGVLRFNGILQDRLLLRSRLYYLLFGGCSLTLGGLILWLIRRRRHRLPMLYVVEGLNSGTEYAVKTDVTRIGAIAQDNGIQNDIILTDLDKSISRFHCELHSIKNRVYVIDCNSSNGTYVDGRRVIPESPVSIGSGSHVRIGSDCTLQLIYRRKI
ncbi:MAG TPA: family 16 glycoside hydrolase [Bryobacteraceae bacterium]|nr:family 16 glycoside hydrolase [Bryobacteraceae bacterium]